MEQVLYLAPLQSDGTLNKGALEALSAALQIARALQAGIKIGLVGEQCQNAANSLAAADAQAILAVQGAEFAVARYSSDAAAFEALTKNAQATIVIAPTSARVSRALPGVCQRLGGRIDTHISGVDLKDNQVQVQRWYYRQRMLATLSRKNRPWFLVIDSGVFTPFQGEAANVSLQNVTVTLPQQRTQVEGIKAPSADAQTIRPDAKLLFVAGAGWTKKQADGQAHFSEAEEAILGFLRQSKASLGSSKSLVDQSGEGHEVFKFMSHLNQVGQTGSTPRHAKGLATCCHGEEPHVVGWRFINERRAVNLDPNCGWAQGKADVLYVADAFKVMQKVNELLQK